MLLSRFSFHLFMKRKKHFKYYEVTLLVGTLNSPYIPHKSRMKFLFLTGQGKQRHNLLQILKTNSYFYG